MLRNSIALAELCSLSQFAIGSHSVNSLSHPFSLVDLIVSDSTGWRRQGQFWENDFVLDDLQVAYLTHAEMATDRYCRQVVSSIELLAQASDPHWIAVTCYYAAFFAAQALLLQAGRGAIRVPPAAGLPFNGVFDLSLTPSQVATGRITLSLKPLRGASHRATWQQTVELVDDILDLEIDARAILVLKTLQQGVAQPNWLSDVRNEINYDLTSSPFRTGIWSSLLLNARGPQDVEDILARWVGDKQEHRFEICVLAFGCLSAELRGEHAARGGRLDRRQIDARKRIMADKMWLVTAD